MTARERWRRAYGYARATSRVMACYRTGMGGHEAFTLALSHEARAWSRLPDNARKAIHDPAGV